DYREDLDQDLALISMELISGGTVRSLLEVARDRGEEVPLPLAWSVLEQMLLALDEAHHQGVMHRDVAPGNVLLAGGTAEDLLTDPLADPGVKLVDFGIAGLLEEQTLPEGRPLGTVAYMAPEVVAKEEATPASDVYGAGAVVYELVTGEPPLGRFEGPSSLRPGVPMALDQLLLKLLERRPRDRPSLETALEVCAELARPGGAAKAVNGRSRTPTAAIDVGRPASVSRWEPVVRTLGWVAVVLLAASLGFFLRDFGDPRAAEPRAAASRTVDEAPPGIEVVAAGLAAPPPGAADNHRPPPVAEPRAAEPRAAEPQVAADAGGHVEGTNGDPSAVAAPPVAVPGKLVVRSVPARAFVYLDGQFVGRSPLQRSVGPGSYKVEVLGAGCEGTERPLTVSPGGSYSLDFKLRCLAEVLPRPASAGRAVASPPVAASRKAVEPPVTEPAVFKPPLTEPEPVVSKPPVVAPKPVSKWKPYGGQGTTLVEGELGIRFVYLSSGAFLMGSAFGEAGRSAEETQHSVKLTRPFWIGEIEITQEQWRRLMEDNPSQHVACGDDCPVEKVTWLQTLRFANALSRESGFEECYRFTECGTDPEVENECLQIAFAGLACGGFRLPTEAEWEFAARAGTTGAFAGGNLAGLAWFRGNAAACTHPVGRKAANPWGLRDMHGNVWEWVWDAWASLPEELATDPLGPRGVHDADRVYRGGSIECVLSGFGRFGCRSASREKGPPDERVANVGFRLVRTAEPPR
ncbi:MAG: SUMF1/EgtB/PvdO family nonheme iron enzyme, partial [Thermoanaerobaculia bacterium]